MAQAANLIQDAIAYLKQNKPQRAVKRLKQALKQQPSNFDALHLMGCALVEAGDDARALGYFEKAVKRNEKNANALYNLGGTYLRLGHFAEAVDTLSSAVALNPNDPETQCDIGDALHHLQRYEESMERYRLAIRLNPRFPRAYNNLGWLLNDMGNYGDAIESCRQALELLPNYEHAHLNIGNAQKNLGKLDEAIESYEAAIQINPEFAEAYSNLGYALLETGRPDDAVTNYSKASELSPNDDHYAINAHLILPIIPESLEHLENWRSRHENGRIKIKDMDCRTINPGATINSPSFYLSYHDVGNLESMVDLSAAFASAIPSLQYTAPHIKTWRETVQGNAKIRIGFLSEFFRAHTIAKIFGSLVARLNRDRFEVVVFYSPQTQTDETSDAIGQAADKAILLTGDLATQQRTIAAESLDMLFYPDIGMAPATYFLAFSRLAPVQLVSFGHPESTGLETMDYFLSSTFMEPDDAQNYYSERLICLNRLPYFFRPPSMSIESASRSDFGLPDSGTLYGCPQSLIKFHPDFDSIMAEILERDPDGHIVLIEGKYASWTRLLKERWAKTHPVLNDRVFFLPPLSQERFFDHLTVMDILLDTIHFCSGLSFYESMITGIPTVTWPGNYMRGRIAAGAYWQMDVANPPVVVRLEDYAATAVDLARDKDRLAALRSDLQNAARNELFDDSKAFNEFEMFLKAAFESARQGEALPAGWRPVDRS